ncbi:MAG: sigma-70 family RNA polymerase sigma factor [Bacillota bacterium]|nr:sigma-70 family RNA polymerase sigma factor [Bacillota bacterium]
MLQQYIFKNKEAHYKMAFSYTKSKEDALDVVQDSIEKALRSYKKNGAPDHLNSWFYRILINTAIDYTRKNKRITLMEQEKMEFLLESEDQYRNFDLETAMEKLPNAYKTIIVLRFFEDLKISDIAEVLGENVNTVKTRLYKGLELLKIEMKEDDNE